MALKFFTIINILCFTFVSCINPTQNKNMSLDQISNDYGSLNVTNTYDRSLSKLIDGYSNLNIPTQQFAIRLTKYAMLDNMNNNFVISPLSLMTALAMTMNGANGATLDSMLNCFGYGHVNLNNVNSYFSKVLKDINLHEGQCIYLSNSIWIKPEFTPLKRSFFDVITTYYSAGVYPLLSSDIINQWVNDKTNGKIPKIIYSLTDNIVLMIINAIYFKGIWKNKFDPSNTERGEFNGLNGPCQVHYMKSKMTIPYKKTDTFQAVTLPYTNQSSFYVYMPAEGLDLTAIMEQLDTNMFMEFSEYETDINIPKFSLEHYIDFSNNSMVLSNLGFDNIFNNSDFSNFSIDKNPRIDKIYQKSMIEISEEGAEAAAVTSFEFYDSLSVPQKAEFYAKRPFFFCIRDEITKSILFIGQVVDPSKL